MKKCKKCLIEKPLSDFHLKTKSKDGHQEKCKRCAIALSAENQRINRERTNEKNKAWKAAHREQVKAARKIYKKEWIKRVPIEKRRADNRKWSLKKSFGITPEAYQSILERQGGVCAICKRPPQKLSLSVDHCHATGRNRGLLCGKCNTSLERLESDPFWAARAFEYLEEYRMSKQDIYGCDPDGGAKEAGNEALRVMKGLGITGTEAKSTGKESSRNDLENLKKGDK